MRQKSLKIYDTTLRDGSQTDGITFTVADKLNILSRLDEFGIDYVEGGWPGANPKDIEFFNEAVRLKLKNTKLVAFGATRRAGMKAKDDALFNQLAIEGVDHITIFGKSWDWHVKEMLKTTLDENIHMISDSITHLRVLGKTVFYDAEHFFDGYKSNKVHALNTIKAAYQAGAEVIVLCDTNGGTLPSEITEIINAVKKELPEAELGIHCHNDSELAVANTLNAVLAGVTQVQGTINGLGERCGNANLISIIANMALKLHQYRLSDKINPDKLTALSHFVDEVANITPDHHQPYVGRSAFAHKGGVHISAVSTSRSAYEHIDPAMVGNTRKILVSEQSGGSTILSKAKDYGVDITKDSPNVRKIINKIKDLEHRGYQFDGAEASFELVMQEALGTRKHYFDLQGYKVLVSADNDNTDPLAEATVKLKVNDEEVFVGAEGDGPVNALDKALRKALGQFYPSVNDFALRDFKVRIVDSQDGTAAKVRVLIESGDGTKTWSTVGVSHNIVEASWEALVDSIEYGLGYVGK